MRAVISEDLRINEVLDLASSFVDWLANSHWARVSVDMDEDEDRPGVSVNILSPAELRSLLEHLQYPDCGIPDPQLREIIRTILQLGCAGMRRAEALKLRSTDIKFAPEMRNDYPLLHLVPYPGRRLKSVSSKRYVPAKLLHPDLQASMRAAAARPADEMLIDAYQATHQSDQAIWLTANRVLQQYLLDPGLHLHHCRHTAATHLLLQLMAAPLGLHRYWGRCHYLDSLLAGADEVAETLTCSNPASLSHLWAVSMLLGHLSPLISLKTYIHCCDWLTYFALDRSGETGYSELLALASGRPLSTVKKHQQLDDSAREHLSRRSLPTLDQRTSDGWSLLHQMEKEYPKSVRRDDTPLFHIKARQQQGPTFANLSELMTHLAHRPSPEEAAILQAAAYLSDASEQSGQGTPDLPCLRAGVMASTAEDWTQRLHKAFLELAPDETESWKSALEILAINIDGKRSLIRVRKDKERKTEAIIDALKRMGFKVRDWRFRPPQARSGSEPEFQSFRRWSDALSSGLPLHLRPAQAAKGFSYEGARWAVVGHLLYLRLRC